MYVIQLGFVVDDPLEILGPNYDEDSNVDSDDENKYDFDANPMLKEYAEEGWIKPVPVRSVLTVQFQEIKISLVQLRLTNLIVATSIQHLNYFGMLYFLLYQLKQLIAQKTRLTTF